MVQPSATDLPSDIPVQPTGISDVDLSSILLVDPDSDTISMLLNLPEGGPFVFLDPGSGAGLNVIAGRLGQSVVSLQGSPGNLTTYFDTLPNIRVQDDPGAVLPDATPQIQITLDDGSALVDAGTVPLAVQAPPNAPPTLTGVPVEVTLTEDTLGPVNLDTLVFADVDSPTITVTLSLSWQASTATGDEFFAPPDGSGVGAGLVATRTDARTLTFVGTPADINAYFDSFPINVVPAANEAGNARGTISIAASDGVNSVDLGSVQINLTPVNDAPTGSIQGLLLRVNAGSQTLDLGPVELDDIDSDTVTVTIDLIGSATTFLEPRSGAIDGVTPVRVSPTQLTVTGPPDRIDRYLADGVAANTPNTALLQNGQVRITISDGIAEPVVLVPINLSARFGVNNPPSISDLPASAPALEDTELPLNFQSAVVVDPDSSEVTLTLTANAGAFGSLGTLAGVTATRVSDTVVTLTGTPGQLTAYLTSAAGNLPFRPPANASGDGAVTIGLSGEDNDGSGLVDIGTLALNVSPVNDAPTDVVLSGTRIDEGAPRGAVVGPLTVIDPDEGDTHRLALLDDAMGLFALNGTNLVVNGTLDHEAAATHTINVQATDAGGLSFEKSFTITVGNVNEAPVANPLTLVALENFPINSVATATDPDGDMLTFALGTVASNGTATIGTDGAVRYEPNIDFTGTDSFTFTVRDGDGATDTRTVDVTIESREVAIPPSGALVVPLDQLDGRSVTGLAPGGAISLNPVTSFTFNDVAVDRATQTVTVPGASFTVDADLSENGFLLFPTGGGGLDLMLLDVLRGDGEDLSEGRAVDASAVNGIAPKGFLKTLTAGQFEVTLNQSRGDFDNALGS